MFLSKIKTYVHVRSLGDVVISRFQRQMKQSIPIGIETPINKSFSTMPVWQALPPLNTSPAYVFDR